MLRDVAHLSLTLASVGRCRAVLLRRFEDWSARTPYVTRHVIISLCFLYILSFFSDVSSALVNCASETIFSLHRACLQRVPSRLIVAAN